MRRFLVVTPFYKPSYVYGGPVRSVSSLCEGLVSLGHRVQVLTTNANGPQALEVPTNTPVDVQGVTVRYFPHVKIGGRFFFSPALDRACRETVASVDLVYVYGIWHHLAIAAGAACRRSNATYVVSPRTSLMRWIMQHGRLRKRVFYRLFGKKYLEGARAVHYTTAVEQQESEALGFGTAGFVVPNSVDFSEFRTLPTAGAFRDRHRVPENAPMVLYLGRVEPRKGLEFTLQAFAANISHPEARLVVAGPPRPGYQVELEQLSVSLGVRERVHFVGYLDPAARLQALVDANVFVLTSHAENFGMAPVEAMAAGTPVLLSDQVGVAVDVLDGGGGIVTPLEVHAISHALCKLLDSATLRRRLGDEGRRLAHKRYGAEGIAQRMLEHLEPLIEASR